MRKIIYILILGFLPLIGYGQIDRYIIYQDGIKIDSVDSPDTTFTATGLAADTEYQFFIQAIDVDGDTSDYSDTLTVTTDALNPCDTTTIVANSTAYPDTNSTGVGAVDMSVSGGTGVYTYLWSNTETTQNISGLTAGVYSVIVQDENSCLGYDTSVVGNFISAGLDTLIWTNTTTTADWFSTTNDAIIQLNISVEPDLDTLRIGYETRPTWILKTNAFIKEFSNDTILSSDNLGIFVTKTNAAIKQVE